MDDAGQRALNAVRVLIENTALEAMNRMHAELVADCRKALYAVLAMRFFVLLNVVFMAWNASRFEGSPMPWLVGGGACLNAWGAWHAFRSGERLAGDRVAMKAAIVAGREMIKNYERRCHES